MSAQRSILALVFVIVLLASLAELIFEGFSLKTIVLLSATTFIIGFLSRINRQ